MLIRKNIFSFSISRFADNANKTRRILHHTSRLFSEKNKKSSLEEFLKSPVSPPIINHNTKPISKIIKPTQDSKQSLEDDFPEFSDPNSTLDRKHIPVYIAFFGGITLIGLYFLYKLNKIRSESVGSEENKKSKLDIGGNWNITDIDGTTLSSLDLKNSYYIIYFGFCNCPEICPNSLNTLKKAYEIIKTKPESSYFNLKVLFVSVDPDRDSPDRIRKFLSHFNKDFIGISGKSNDDPQLKDLLKKFRIYATKIEFETTNEKGELQKGYTYDHTTIAYLISDSNEYLTHLGSNVGVNKIADTIIDTVMDNENQKISSKNLKLYKAS
jgi:protein SCO1/2